MPKINADQLSISGENHDRTKKHTINLVSHAYFMWRDNDCFW